MNADRVASETTDPFTPDARHIAVVSAGLGDPSSTRLLADRLADATAAALAGDGIVPELHVVELRTLAGAIANMMVSMNPSPELRRALDCVEQADAIITTTPIFRASYSGLFKSFWDLVEETSIVDVPVLLGATGGTPRHSLVIDFAMRPLFGYFKADAIPTAVFAAADDWGDVSGGQESRRTDPLDQRIQSAGRDLAEAMLRRDARPRKAPAKAEEVRLVPFAQLLRDLGN